MPSTHRTPFAALLPAWLAWLLACQPGEKRAPGGSHASTNALAGETSPYLRGHARNPVQWHPWGAAALQKAQRENKPLLISIGYAACHWCHVMERESFADTAVARVMNEHFICVMVDREERPDVDQRYAAAAEVITGNAGWPLNCLALPDGRPFFAGTYYPRAEWTRLLQEYASLYHRDPEALRVHAEKVSRGIEAGKPLPTARAAEPDRKALSAAFANWVPAFDTREGGYGRVPKFPLPASLQALLGYYHFTRDSTALKQALLTLNKLADGGIYDHLGGGFSRYAVDRSWRVPHFEKMLYDNAQLASVYARAHQLTGNDRYKAVLGETLDFVAREMTGPEGGCYGSVDADSEGEEGRFYAWSGAELDQHLGPQAAAFKAAYHVTPAGNWEAGRNILYRTGGAAGEQALAESRRKLLAVRQARVRPAVDRKVVTGWHALMIRAYTDGYRATGEEKWLRAALRGGAFVRQRLRTKDGGLYRQFAGGKASGPGFLEDYAFAIDAFLGLYGATFDESWLHDAHALLGAAAVRFGDNGAGYFYDSADTATAALGSHAPLTDNALPSGNSVMARNLFYLGHYFYRDAYLQRARRMAASMLPAVKRNPLAHANWFALLTHLVQPFYEVAVVGEGFAAARRELDRHYLPNVLLLGGAREGSLELLRDKYVPGRTTFYVCRDRACKKPVTSAAEALAQLK